MLNANSEASDKFRPESELAFELLCSRLSRQMTGGDFEFIRRSHSQMNEQDSEFRQYRRGKYRFFSYGIVR